MSVRDRPDLPAQAGPGKGRVARQDRSAARQQRVTRGAIRAIARYGLAGLTHRRVAQEAHVSLAATTYYFEGKDAIVADASRTLLLGYVAAFRRLTDRCRGDPDRVAVRDIVFRLVSNAAGRDAGDSLAWCEIILNAARSPRLTELSRSWFGTLTGLWREMTGLLRVDAPDAAATSAIDVAIGFLFLVVPLGLGEADLRAMLWSQVADPPEPDDARAQGGKAQETRRRILDAAVDILIAKGTRALTFRSVAHHAGLTAAAPTYHFTTISALWNAAQLHLFERSKRRYRTIMGAVDYAALDVPRLVDLTAAVFLREAVEFRSLSLACYPIYIQSRRDSTLRPGLSAINAEQWRRWHQVLRTTIPASTPFDAWILYALFTGKLIRVLSTGVETAALARIRGEFAYDIEALAGNRHWSRSE